SSLSQTARRRDDSAAGRQKSRPRLRRQTGRARGDLLGTRREPRAPRRQLEARRQRSSRKVGTVRHRPRPLRNARPGQPTAATCRANGCPVGILGQASQRDSVDLGTSVWRETLKRNGVEGSEGKKGKDKGQVAESASDAAK